MQFAVPNRSAGGEESKKRRNSDLSRVYTVIRGFWLIQKWKRLVFAHGTIRMLRSALPLRSVVACIGRETIVPITVRGSF